MNTTDITMVTNTTLVPPDDNRTIHRMEFLWLSRNTLTVPINGYISPLLVIFTLITNSLICAVLLKPHMRSPTNVLLVAIAVSDMCTGMWSVPCYVYFYTLGNFVDYTPYEWCWAYHLLTDKIPTLFHTASIWLTLTLAIQRYIYICHSTLARTLCTINNVLKVILGIYIASFLTHISRWFDMKYIKSEVVSTRNPNVTFNGCYTQYYPFISKVIGLDLYFNVYLWFRVIFINLVPCISLVVITVLLIRALREAQSRRKQLFAQNRKSECKKVKESNRTTLMLVIVVCCFLLVEVPFGIMFILVILQNTLHLKIFITNPAKTIHLINFAVILSYPINFFIYCGMSNQFRKTFRSLFIPSAPSIDREHTNYMSLAENGKEVITKDTTL